MRVALLVLLSLSLLAGCVGDPAPGADADTATAETATRTVETATPSPSPSPTPPTPVYARTDAPTTPCPDVGFVGLWGRSEASFWEPDTVRYGTPVPGETSLLYVAYLDGRVAGYDRLRFERNGSVNVDGGEIPLGRAYEGRHTVRVVVHRDADESGTFDPATDPACTADGAVIRSSRHSVDFSRFEAAEG